MIVGEKVFFKFFFVLWSVKCFWLCVEGLIGLNMILLIEYEVFGWCVVVDVVMNVLCDIVFVFGGYYYYECVILD